jgi:Putative transposase/Transposase zinc-binding domain
MRPVSEVAGVLEQLGSSIESAGLNTHQLRTLSAIKACRTPALGGHVDVCDDCGVIKISYNSCRNRHCPKCQGHKREEWIQKRTADLLPVPYFHVVFTLPDTLNGLALYRPAMVYDALFKAAWQTIHQFAGNKGLQAGMVCVLHTWGQTLGLHPHLHCIVPGAGVNAKGYLTPFTTKGKYLFPVKALSKVFRAKYVARLREKGISDKKLMDGLFTKDWVVYAKRPFGGPRQVIEYLGRYTHKIAISNHRLQNVDETSTTFSYKDYKSSGSKKQMTLSNGEFIRRFALHILPLRFVRIRHYGIFSSTWKRAKFVELRKRLKMPATPIEIETKLHRCPCCQTGTLITIAIFGKRGPPGQYKTGENTSAC